MTQHRARARVRAPELVGRGGWLNTGGEDLSLADLRGRFAVVDFWTFCCINCLHVLDELRPLEEQYGDGLTIIGVHSPKFVHEAEHEAVVAAVERYGVHHPVLDDPDLTTWQQYAVRAWPTLTLIDPEGYIVAQFSGEGHAHALTAILDELIPVHEVKGTLRRGDGPYVPPEPEPSTLRFPGKVVALPGGRFLVSDSGNHSLVELADDLETVVRRIGTGERGLADGGPGEARFNEPQGLTLLPPELHSWTGYEVVVADTVNHVLRGVRLADGHVSTIAGTGSPWMQGDPNGDDVSGDPRAVPMSSPWDVAWSPAHLTVVVAMAGIHQLWAFDPKEPSIEVLAGTTNEGLVDGKLRDAWFAQTSGLAVTADRTLWLADSETSALRAVRDGAVETAVGTGLFDFGFRDGPAGQALLQHPLGVTALPDGSVAISDTYNNAVRRYDPATGEVSTLATGLREPSGAVVDGEHLVVVESAAHRLTRVPLGSAATASGSAHRTQRPPLDVAPGEVELVVVFDPPPGQKLDERYGSATRLTVSSTPAPLLAGGEGRDTALTRRLTITPDGDGAGVLHVAAMAASCDDGGENAACHIHQQDWGIPVRVVDGGASSIELVLSG
ncbi:NHL domain-containing thioredoxin family protein [Jiangella alkaliphila]|uniref:Thiol-disulfide isomerase or thioredoxin n=1 Tax=Jiangella alkaliphila TaxID=419479 RepID=A0A1H2HXA9_9ACTN|nr:NHL domain-containing thioredoxin family protein [Jiangella alkaliphila]SDU36521.1 Thiol-disulfide isomerase or thioredoxin [Jiangella alkaliphila]